MILTFQQATDTNNIPTITKAACSMTTGSNIGMGDKEISSCITQIKLYLIFKYLNKCICKRFSLHGELTEYKVSIIPKCQ